LRSHIGSTGGYRQSGGQETACRIHIPIVARSATRALSLANRERQSFVVLMPAYRADLGTREPAINRHQFPAIPAALVIKHISQLVPGSIRDGSGQLVVLEHAAHVQILDYDRLVFADESSGEFMQVVGSLVGDSRVYSSNFPSRLDPISRTSSFSGKSSLCEGEAFSVSGFVLRVGDFLSIRQRYQAREPNIQPDRSGCVRQRLDRPVLHEQTYEPATCAVTGYGDRGRLRAFRKRPRPYDGQWFRHLRKPQLAVPEIEGRASVLCRSSRFPLRLEAGVLGSSLPKRNKSTLQMPQSLLQWYRGNFVKECQFFGLLPACKQRGCFVIADPSSLRVPRFGSNMQSLIVDKSDASEGSRQFHFLYGCRVEAVLVRSPHGFRWHVEHAIEYECKSFNELEGGSGEYFRPRRRSITMEGK